MDDVHLDVVGGKADKGVGECLYGTVDVALHHNVEFLVITDLQATADFVKGKHLGGTEILLALELETFSGNVTGFLLRAHDVELVAGLGCTVKSEQGGGMCRTYIGDALAALVEEGLYAAVVCTCNHDVALMEGTVADKYGSYITASLVKRRLDDGSRSITVGVRLEFQHVGFEEDFLEEFVDSDALFGRNVLALVLAAPLFHKEVHGRQGGLDGIGICSGLVNLVDGKDDRYSCSHGMVNGLFGLRHDVVVGSDDDDGDVRHLCTACTHGCEGFVTGGIEEGDFTSVLQTHVVGTDMLGDASGLAGNDVGIADMVEKRCLTVVDVTHDGDNGSALHKVLLTVFGFHDGLADFCTDEFSSESELIGHEVNGFLVKTLVDADHDADAHACTDDLGHGHIHHGSQFVGRNEFRKLEDFCFGIVLHDFLFGPFTGSLTLFLTVFGTLGTLGLALQACKRFLYLLCYVLLADLLRLLLRLVLSAFLSALCIGILLACGISGAIASTVALVLFLLVALCISLHITAFCTDVDTFASYTGAFFLFTTGSSSIALLLASSPFPVLFLCRTGIGVKG